MTTTDAGSTQSTYRTKRMPARPLAAMPAPLEADTRDGTAAGQYECCIWNRVIGGLTPKLAGRTRASGTRGCGGRSHSMWMGAACGTVTPGQTAIGAAIVERSRNGDPGSARMNVRRRNHCGARTRSSGAPPGDAPIAFDGVGHRADEQKKRHAFAWRFSSCPTAKFGRDLEAGASGARVLQRPCLPIIRLTFQTTTPARRKFGRRTVNDFDTGHAGRCGPRHPGRPGRDRRLMKRHRPVHRAHSRRTLRWQGRRRCPAGTNEHPRSASVQRAPA